MPPQHRAYVLDYDAFSSELRPILERALSSGETQGLRQLIEANLDELKDPYAGEPLEPGWETLLETGDAQELGDFALTKYYDPADDIGLGPEWPAVQDLLVQKAERGALLTPGHTVGPGNNAFDPGQMGSYFMTNGDARDRLEAVKRLVGRERTLHDRLASVVAMYETIVGSGKGAYMTF